jgi:Fe-S cluster biogenesis protein NfuA
VSSERIESLLAQLRATADPPTLARVEELLECLLGVYGSGLARILALVSANGAMSDGLQRALVEDPLISALLTLHGLHPHDVTVRIEAALDRVRPTLGSHAGGVSLVGIDERRVVHVRLQGSCDGCASSEATLHLLVRQAIEEAAPEVAGVTVDSASGAGAPTTNRTGSATHPTPLLQLGRRRV